jgi:hypothetical protein
VGYKLIVKDPEARIHKPGVGVRFIEPEKLGSDKSDHYGKRHIAYALIADAEVLIIYNI